MNFENPAAARKHVNELVAKWFAKGDESDGVRVKLLAEQAKTAIKAWEAAAGPTQWERSAHDAIAKLEDRLANPPAPAAERPHDPASFKPSSTERKLAWARANEAERAAIAKRRVG